MGQAKIRRTEIEDQSKQVKLTPRQQASSLTLLFHRRIEETREDGMVLARNVFRVVDGDGNTLQEETPDGPRPVLLMSVPQPVKKSVLASRLVRVSS